MSLQSVLVDVLELRRHRRDALSFMTRAWRPQLSWNIDRPLSPRGLKEEVARSINMGVAVQVEASASGETEDVMNEKIRQILEEMGLDRKMYVVRALGVAFIRTALAMHISVFVNEQRWFQLKSLLGVNPVLFLPTHRSYADFCLMTYLCYHYDIHLPAVAAGMDFYHMAGMGRIMRDTGAFYIPRSLAGAQLHAHVLRRYVRALLTRYPAPIEFFVEGARSRSNKCLSPKYGLMSMCLLPLFTREVPDVTLVPVSITYERIVEQTLFAYEHLGVPKPKETTRGLLKTLSFLNDDFGDIYVSLDEPASATRLLGDLATSMDLSQTPLELQQLNPAQFGQVQTLVQHAVARQQEIMILSTYTLIATVLLQCINRGSPLDREHLLEEVRWLCKVAQNAGAKVVGGEVESKVDRALHVHRSSACWDRNRRLRLLCPPIASPANNITAKTKGHPLEARTMQTAVPLIQLQLYVNPLASRLFPSALLHALVSHAPRSRDELRLQYDDLRKLHKFEFVYDMTGEDEQYSRALSFCLDNGAVTSNGDGFVRGSNCKLHDLLDTILSTSICTLLAIIHVARETGTSEQGHLLRRTQQHVEQNLPDAHPYCFSLEALKNLTAGLSLCGALTLSLVAVKDKPIKETHYAATDERLASVERVLKSVAPHCRTVVTNNPVLLLQASSLL